MGLEVGYVFIPPLVVVPVGYMDGAGERTGVGVVSTAENFSGGIILPNRLFKNAVIRLLVKMTITISIIPRKISTSLLDDI